MTDEVVDNDQLVLISGESGTGKSASLMNIRDQEDWLYLGTEAGKRLPFKNSFQNFRISDPHQILEGFDYGIAEPNVKGIIVDSLTFMMDLYESMYVLGSANTMAGWGNFQQFFKEIMQQKVVQFGRPVIFTAHTRSDLNEKTAEMVTAVPIKGALRGNGIESYFSTVASTKKMSLKDLKGYENDLLNITEEDELVGYKHVYQTRITKNTTGERIRSPMGLFTVAQTYIDNDAQLLLDHLHNYYKQEIELCLIT